MLSKGSFRIEDFPELRLNSLNRDWRPVKPNELKLSPGALTELAITRFWSKLQRERKVVMVLVSAINVQYLENHPVAAGGPGLVSKSSQIAF